MTDSFLSADSYICQGALVERDESAKRVHESYSRINESGMKNNESGGENVGNEEIVWRIHF